MLKILNGIYVELMECLNDDAKKKKGHFLYIVGRDILITTGANLFDTKYRLLWIQ